MPTDSEQIAAVVEANAIALRAGVSEDVNATICPQKRDLLGASTASLAPAITFDTVQDITVHHRSAVATVRHHADADPGASIISTVTLRALGNQWFIC